MAIFPAIIHKEDNSDWGISFPDFPGCVSAGETIEEALAMGAEALQFHIDGMAADGEDIPPPLGLEQAATLAGKAGGALVMIKAEVPDERVERVNITLPRSTLRVIDSVTSNRSGFLNEAALLYVSQKNSSTAPLRHKVKTAVTKKAAGKPAKRHSKTA